MQTAAINVHAFIICWGNMADAARHIASEILPMVENLTVIYSNKNSAIETGSGDWVMVSDEWYYGKKFEECLRRNAGDIMLQIQADAVSDDWPQIISRCKTVHAKYKNTGVWAPDVDYTYWDFDKVKIGSLEKGHLALVAQTDCTVWSMSSPIIKRLQDFNYDCNNFGWGIDWAAISYSMSHNLLVFRDMSVKIKHPASRGYDGGVAKQQKLKFISQMSVQEMIQYEILNALILLKIGMINNQQNKPATKHA